MAFLCEGLHAVGNPNEVEAFLECITRSVSAAAIGVQTCYIKCIDAFGTKEAFHVGTLETAVSRFWHAKVARLHRQLGNNFR